MFQGFNESTVKYFEAIRKENSRSNYKANESLYLEGVKEPLEELYYELFNYFEKAGLLELQGELYKKKHYPEADAALKPLLGRKRLAFVRECSLNEAFFRRSLLDSILVAYDSMTDIYRLMKEALKNT